MRIAVLPALIPFVCGVACGGSSSETPPPLEPDATSARYVGPRVGPVEEAAPAAAPEVDEDDRPEELKKPAAATWGSGRPARHATPAAPAAAASAAPTATAAGARSAEPAPAPAPSAAPAPGEVFRY